MKQSTSSVETILSEAVEIASTTDRQAFVEESCSGDPILQERVERMIADHFQAGTFLERPASPLDAYSTGTFAAAFIDDKPGTMIGSYKLLEQIGEGGMGVVYVAEQQHPVRRRVALKIIKPGMDSRQVVARFEAERQALAMMDHPNIAKVFDGGAITSEPRTLVSGSPLPPQPLTNVRGSDRPYFVMELVKGAPITEYCDTHRLSTRQRLKLFLDVCGAVQHAHQKGIIHRDLKPSNILVSLHDVMPIVKVIDFGIAKATGGQLTDKTVYTQVAQLIGTPMYMSPEQAGLSDLDVDTRSDVYSLGVLLYELLTGTTPFDGETLKKGGFDEMRRIIREDEPPRPSARLSTMQQVALSTIAERRGQEPQHISRHLRGELDWIVMRALEKDRNRRYESASAFAADLQRYLDDAPVEACPPSTAYRLQKFARRNKAALTSTAVVALALLLGMGVSLWQAVEAHRANLLADERLEKEKQAHAETEEQSQKAEARYGKALEAVKRMLTEVGDEKILPIPQMQETRMRLLEDAVTFYTELIALNPDHAQTYFERAKVHLLLGKYEGVRADLGKALSLEPDNDDFHGLSIHMNTYFKDYGFKPDDEKGYKEQQLQRAKRAVERYPTTTNHCRLAQTYNWAGLVDPAVEEYLKAASLAPDTFLAYQSLATAAVLKGDLKNALQHFEKAVETKNFAGLDREGRTSPSTDQAWAFIEFANVHQKLGDNAQALVVLNRGLERTGVSGKARAHLLVGRGDVHVHQGKFDAALADYDTAFQLDPELVRGGWPVYKRRGWAHFHLKHYDLALVDLAKAFEMQASDVSNLTWIGIPAIGACHDEGFRKGLLALADRTVAELSGKAATQHGGEWDAFYVRSQLLTAFDQPQRARTDLDKAIALLESMFSHQKAKLGPEHPDTLTCMNNLAVVYMQVDRLQESVGLLKQNLEKRKAKLGPEHRDSLMTMNNLADAFRCMGRFEDAIPLYEQTLDKMKAKLGPEDENTLVTLYNLANTYQDAGKLVQSGPLLRDLLEAHRKKYGPKSHETTAVLATLSFNLLKQQKYSEAEPYVRECLSFREQKMPDNWLFFNTRSVLGETLLGQKKYAESEPLLLQGYEGMKQREKQIPPQGKLRLTEAIERLVRLYEATNQSEKAKAWREKQAAEKGTQK